MIDDGLLKENRLKEISWIKTVICTNITIKKSWSSYHSNLTAMNASVPCNKTIFPLLKDVVHTLEMQHHLISTFISYTKYLNPDQKTAVDCSDQPIYALSKINQWLFPIFNMPEYFPLFGGLHIEQAILIAHGKLIAGSGLEELFEDMELETVGLKTATLDVNHIHKSRYAIQLSSVAINTCLKRTLEKSMSESQILEWANEVSKSNLMFKYWLTIFNLQIDYLIFVQSLSERNFLLFVNVLKSLVKWFFIFDQYNYARWISVHLQDLIHLPLTCPNIYKEFLNGHIDVQITEKSFSKIHYDHAHEQSNKTIKSIRGPIDFVNQSDENIQRRWEIAGAEIADYLESAQSSLKESNNGPFSLRHHEDNHSFNNLFLKESAILINRLMHVNPFFEKRFVKIGTNSVFDEAVEQFAMVIPEIGDKQFEAFVNDRMITGKKLISEKITKNNFQTPAKVSTKTKLQSITTLKEAQFIKLRASLTFRPILSKDLFKNDFTGLPECLTKEGNMYHGEKSNILNIFASPTASKSSISPESVIIDFSFIIQSTAAISKATTFDEFSKEIITTIKKLARHSSRVDIVCDSYFKDSIKGQTRSSRGCGQLFDFKPYTPLPGKMKDDFLRNNENKKALNLFLTNKILDAGIDLAIVISLEDEIHTNNKSTLKNLNKLEKSTIHEEADV